MSSEPFTLRVQVRIYEVDPQLHLNGAVYLQYADHSRHECARAAGVSVDEMLAAGIGPVNLETVVRYRNELRAGDEVDVTCEWTWRAGKTYTVKHAFKRTDGEIAAEVEHVSGLLDLTQRRLLPDPASEWARRAAQPGLLGLPQTPTTPSGSH